MTEAGEEREDWREALHREYADALPTKLDLLRTLLAALRADPGAPGAHAALRAAVHRLSGSAGSYGFTGISQIATAWEERLMALAGRLPTALDLQAMDQWMAAIDQEAPEPRS